MAPSPVETCRFDTELSSQSDFVDMRLDESAQRLAIATRSQVNTYDLVDCTTIEPFATECEIGESCGDEDLDGIRDSLDCQPSDPDANQNGIPDGQENTVECPNDGCIPNPEDSCPDVTCTEGDGCQFDDPRTEENEAAGETGDGADGFGADIGMGLAFDLLDMDVSEGVCILFGILWIAFWGFVAALVSKKSRNTMAATLLITFGAVTAYVLFCFYLWMIIVGIIAAGAIIVTRRGL